MRTQTTIIREYANGCADGFMNDLAGGHIPNNFDSENALIEAFIRYVSSLAAKSEQQPCVAAAG